MMPAISVRLLNLPRFKHISQASFFAGTLYQQKRNIMSAGFVTIRIVVGGRRESVVWPYLASTMGVVMKLLGLTAMRSNPIDGLIRAAAIVLLTAASSLRLAAAENSQDESAKIADWRAKRLESLTSETGWLTPIALYWLKDGENSFGRAPDRAFSLDDAALAADTGAFVLTNGRVRYVAHASTSMTYLGKPVTSLDLVSDVNEKPTELVAGPLHFMLIERAGHLGIRVRDSVSPNRLQFRGLQYFPVRADWHIQAHFEPYVPERRIPIVNILGMTEDMTSPGAIVFERDGRTWRLDAILEAPGDRELFVMFSDATSGKETYGAGRFLYVGLPNADRIEVDFNQAYNPPCAFTNFATCPLPPRQNQLALAIDAGELKYERAH
jgi:uncharacterized protein (DUF1684 family)